MGFPNLIHVIEEDAGDDTTFLCVVEDGVVGIQDDGTKVAVYQKVSEGVVHIEKTFVEKKGKR
jgi:hypothetical protein